MNVRIKRINKKIPLPKYETGGSVALDLLAREETKIAPKSLALIPMNIIIETPPGFMFLVAPRSSTPKKNGLLSPHGIGIIDQDFCGPKDEVHLLVYNFTNEQAVIQKGDRVGQGVFVKVEKAELEEIDSPPSQATRGGFGSTG